MWALPAACPNAMEMHHCPICSGKIRGGFGGPWQDVTQLPHIPKVGSGAHGHPAPGTCAPQMPASREALRRLTPSSAAPSRQARRPWATGYPVLKTGLFFIRIQNPSRSPEALHSARARSLASPSLVPREGLMLKSRTHGCRRSRLINANPCPKAQAVRPPPERTVPVIHNGGEPRGGRSRTASQTDGAAGVVHARWLRGWGPEGLSQPLGCTGPCL